MATNNLNYKLSFLKTIQHSIGRKWRGKRGNEWVYGDFREKNGEYYIADNNSYHPVDRDTVGQCMGIWYSDGCKEIFHGDLVKYGNKICALLYNCTIGSYVLYEIRSNDKYDSIDIYYLALYHELTKPLIPLGNIWDDKEKIPEVVT